jgi:hypothetical protein
VKGRKKMPKMMKKGGPTKKKTKKSPKMKRRK